MKILLIGHKGWIGQQVRDILNHQSISCLTKEGLRVDDVESVQNVLEELQPTHVISVIGRTHGKIDQDIYSTIDYLEQPGKLVENVRDNLFAPMVLAQLCQYKGIHLTYLGTGCIFQYDEQHPWEQEKNGFTEESLPNFFGSSYSVVKGFTDRLMSLYGKTVLNVRIRMPITGDFHSRNFITKIIHYPKICSIRNSMTVLPELLPFMIDMCLQKVTGTINLVNPGLISHNDILEMYREIVDPSFQWDNFSVEEQAKILAADRSNNYLNTSKLQKMYPEVLPVKESIRKILFQMRKINCVV